MEVRDLTALVRGLGVQVSKMDDRVGKLDDRMGMMSDRMSQMLSEQDHTRQRLNQAESHRVTCSCSCSCSYKGSFHHQKDASHLASVHPGFILMSVVTI